MPFNWHPGAPGGGFFSATWVGHPGVRTNDEVCVGINPMFTLGKQLLSI
jgi:hypothetical protein